MPSSFCVTSHFSGINNPELGWVHLGLSLRATPPGYTGPVFQCSHSSLHKHSTTYTAVSLNSSLCALHEPEGETTHRKHSALIGKNRPGIFTWRMLSPARMARIHSMFEGVQTGILHLGMAAGHLSLHPPNLHTARTGI